MITFKKIFHPISVVCFDLDNTLYDKRVFELGAYQKIGDFLSSSYRLDSALFVRETSDMSLKKGSNYGYLFEEVLDKYNLNRHEVIELVLDIYRNFRPKALSPYDQVEEILGRLSQTFKLSMITDGYPVTQKNKIAALGISPYFSKIVYTQQLGPDRQYRKPHPLAYEIILSHYGIQPSQMLYVGDNPHVDFAGAAALGIGCIRILTGEFSQVKLPDGLSGHVYTFRTLSELFLNHE